MRALILVLSLVFISGLFYSRALLSIGTIAIPLSGLLITLSDQAALKSIIKNPLTWICWGFMAVTALGFFYSGDTAVLTERLRVRLPFLFFPFCIPFFKLMDVRLFELVKRLFVVVCFSGVLYSAFLAIGNWQEIVESYTVAKVLPTPVHHIRFSLMVALAAFICFDFLLRQKTRDMIFISTIFLFICFVTYLHVLAVRSGLLALYGGVFLMAVIYLFQQKKYFLLLVSSLALFLLPVLAYFLIPTFAHKFNYMMHDLKMYQQGEREVHYSDMRRIISLEAGWNAVLVKPLIGHGYGNVRQAMNTQYDLMEPPVPDVSRTLPHNQFLFSWIGGGVFAFIFISLLAVYLFLIPKSYKFLTPIAFQFSQLSSFMTEHPLETQIGTALCLYFLWLFYAESKTNSP